MREFKFRAWYEDGKKMISGFPSFHNDHFYDGRGLGIDFRVLKLMQSTGLKDKHGKDIYEGDIVRGERDGEAGMRQVMWSHRLAGFLPFCSDNDPRFDEHTLLEVIGNMYEHPELLS